MFENLSFLTTKKTLSSGFRELLSVVKFTENYIPVQNSENSIIYWLTDSKNLFSFLKKGSRKQYIQSEILKIKLYECVNCVNIVPIWVARSDDNLVLADLGSKFINFTDEWSIDSVTFKMISNYFSMMIPTFECFASDLNYKLQRIFFKNPTRQFCWSTFFCTDI